MRNNRHLHWPHEVVETSNIFLLEKTNTPPNFTHYYRGKFLFQSHARSPTQGCEENSREAHSTLPLMGSNFFDFLESLIGPFSKFVAPGQGDYADSAHGQHLAIRAPVKATNKGDSFFLPWWRRMLCLVISVLR